LRAGARQLNKRSKGKRSPAPALSTFPKVERAFSRVISAFAGDREVAYGSGKGFGKALKVEGKVFAMISSKGKLVIKLPSRRVDELVRQRTGEYFDGSHGTLMKEWVALEGAYSSWIKLAKEARRFVGGGK
jgi:hypothetical protein